MVSSKSLREDFNMGVAAFLVGSGIALVGGIPFYLEVPEGIISVCATITVVAGVIVGAFGLVILGGTLEGFPSAKITSPPILRLIRTEPWRRATSLRCVESLKQELLSAEKHLIQSHERSYNAYRRLLQENTISEYKELLDEKKNADCQVEQAQRTVTSLKQRIDRIYSGDVATEQLHLNESIKKLERDRQEEQRKLSSWDAPCSIRHETQADVSACRANRSRQLSYLRSAIHGIDIRIIELQTHSEELRNVDFAELWLLLGRPDSARRGLAAVSQQTLQDMKTRAETLRRIPALGPPKPPKPRQPPAIKPSPEEIRAREKARIEAQLQQLAVAQQRDVARATSEIDRNRLVNIYGNRRHQLMQEMEDYLV